MAAISFLQLPIEVTQQICNWVRPRDLLRVRQTCRELNERTFLLFAQRFFESRCVMILPESLENLRQISQHPVLSKAVRTLEISTLYFVPIDELKPFMEHDHVDDGSWCRTPAAVAYQACHSAQQELLKGDRNIPPLTDALKSFTNCTSISTVDLHTRVPWGLKALTRRLEISFPPKADNSHFGLKLESFITSQNVSQMSQESGPGVHDLILSTVMRLAMDCHVPVQRLNIFSQGDPDSACHRLSEYHSSELSKVDRLNFVLVSSNCTCWAHDGGKGWKDSVKLIASCPELTHVQVFMMHRLRFANLSYIQAPKLASFELYNMELRDADIIEFFRRHRETLRSVKMTFCMLQAANLRVRWITDGPDLNFKAWSQVLSVLRDETNVEELYLKNVHSPHGGHGPFRANSKDDITRVIAEMAESMALRLQAQQELLRDLND